SLACQSLGQTKACSWIAIWRICISGSYRLVAGTELQRMDYVRTSCVDPRDAGSHSGNRQCHTPGSCGSPARIPSPGFLYPVGVPLARGDPGLDAVLSLRLHSYIEMGSDVC